MKIYKIALQEAILKLIREFEQRHGVCVDINQRHMERMGQGRRTNILDIVVSL